MLRGFRGGARRRALTSVFLVSTALAASLVSPAFATDYTITGTDTSAKTLTGTDTLTLGTSSDTLEVSGVAATLSGATSAPGTIIYNSGSIISDTDRAIRDTGSSGARYITIHNYAGATVSGSDDAVQFKNNVTSGTITVDNSGTIASSTGQALDFANIISGGVSIGITNGAGGLITSDGNDAIRPGAGTITIDNSGMIKADSTGSRAINADNSNAVITSFMLTNRAGGDIESDDDAVRISSSPTSVGNVTVDNYGTIKTLGTDGGQAIDFDGLVHATGTTTTITNETTGVISSTNADAVRPGSNATVYNYGSITAGSTDMTGGFLNDGSSDGIDLQAHDGVIVNGAIDNTTASITGARHGITTGLGQTVTVTNYGSITGSNGSGVGSDGYGSVTNYGTITGTANLAYCSGNPDCFGDGDGVDIDYSATVTNYGTIQGTGSVGIKPGETNPSKSEGLALGGGTVVNGDDTHTSALVSGADYGITVDDSNDGDAVAATSITNYGTIQGLNGYAIKLTDDAGSYSNQIDNYGTISGTTFAVEMGNGDDIFNDFGGTVSGLVDAQGGDDTLNITRDATGYTFDGSQWTNFETTNVVTGTVTLSGNYTSATAFNIYAPAIFVGTGTLTTGQFTNSGTLKIGGASATNTFTIAGDFVSDSGSFYEVNLAATSSDLLHVTGAATLNGGTVSVLDLPNVNHQTYTILSAANGVTGTFGTLDISPFVTASLDYSNPYVVTLTIDSVADTQSGSSVANALNNAGTDLGLGATLSPGEIPGALDDLSPNSPGSDTTGGTVTSFAFSNQVSQHIALLQSDVASEHGTTRLAMAGDEAGDLMASLVGGATVSPAASSGFWLRGFGLTGNLDAQSGQANGLSYKGGGVEGGYDHFIGEQTLVGISAGFARVVNDPDRVGASSDVTSYAAGLYAAAMLGSYDLAGQLGFVHNAYHESRYITFAGETASADYDGSTFSGNAELGRTFASGAFALRPAAGIDMMRLMVDDYTETGAPGYNLAAASQSSNLVRSTLGASASFDGGSVSPSLGLRWGHDFAQADGALSYAFAGLANSGFLVDRNTPARDALLVDAGLDAKLAEMVDLSLAGSADLRSNAQGYGLSLKLRCTW